MLTSKLLRLCKRRIERYAVLYRSAFRLILPTADCNIRGASLSNRVYKCQSACVGSLVVIPTLTDSRMPVLSSPRLWPKWALTFSILVWLGCIAFGFGVLLRYETTPSAAAGAPLAWPPSSVLPRDAHLYSLVMFVHPQCPCTAASLSELNVITSRCHNVKPYIEDMRIFRERDDWQAHQTHCSQQKG